MIVRLVIQNCGVV